MNGNPTPATPSAPAATPAPATPAPAPKAPAAKAPPAAPKAPSKPSPTPKAPAVVEPKGPRVMSVRKALGLPEEKGTKEEIAASIARTRARYHDGKFKPENPPGQKKEADPTPKKPAKPETPPKSEVTNPEEEPEKVEGSETPEGAALETTPAVPKIKIGDKEYTVEEAAARMAELEAKANGTTSKEEAPKPPETPKEPEETPEAKAAREAEEARTLSENRRRFLDSQTKAFKPEDYGFNVTAADLDTVLNGGEEGVATFMSVITRAAVAGELRAREYAADAINRAAEKIMSQLNPAIERERQIAEYSQEQAFYEKHKDLATHREAVRNIATALRHHYPNEVAAMTADQFADEVATHVRENIKLYGNAAQPAPAAPTPTPEPAKPAPVPRPKPPVGHSPSSLPAKTPGKTAVSSLLPPR